MSDVTVVILTLGEPTFQSALDSIHRQELAPKDIVIVRDQEPVSKAFRVGAERVKTPFFLEWDADMILTPDCTRVLRSGMEDDVGVTIGFLRDEILGDIQAVKLFRKEAVLPSLSASITSDSDTIGDMLQRGWKIKFCRRERNRFNLPEDVFGLHSP